MTEETDPVVVQNEKELKKTMDKERYGIFAESVVAFLDNELVRIVIDDPLPDDDRVEIFINKHKLAGLVTKSVAQNLIKDAKQLKFFGEEIL